MNLKQIDRIKCKRCKKVQPLIYLKGYGKICSECYNDYKDWIRNYHITLNDLQFMNDNIGKKVYGNLIYEFGIIIRDKEHALQLFNLRKDFKYCWEYLTFTTE